MSITEEDSHQCQASAATFGVGRQRLLQVDVLLLDGTIKQVELDYRARGQDCLEKVCRWLGVIEEADYFGLTYRGVKHEELWVNTRNRLWRQLPPLPAGCGVARLQLRVKFYPAPHMLLLEETRHLVYLDFRSRLIDQGDWLLESDVDSSLLAELAALMAQAEAGDRQSPHEPPPLSRYRRWFWPGVPDLDRELLALAAESHAQLAGTPASVAEYRTLQVASARLAMYGCHYHDAKDCFEGRLTVAVGPNAICLCHSGGRKLTDRYPYPRVQKVTINDRILYLSLSQENGAIKELGFRLVTQKAANGLYRCVTETHSFFRCETVRNDVAAQTSRDVKGALVSLFVERDSSAGREFVFDVQRTAKEVHDDTRRQIYKYSTAVARGRTTGESAVVNCKAKTGAPGQQGETRDQLLERIRALETLRQCRICMDAPVSVAFVPCGHVIACGDCSNRLATCPACRQPVDSRQACFVPWA